MPTGGERTVWGMGDGSELGVVSTPFGVVGGLICWENYMPLARFSLYESGVEIYVASTADDSDAWQATLVHIARESRAFVVSPCHFQRADAYPDDPDILTLYAEAEMIGPVELKGRKAPVVVYRITGLVDVERRHRGLPGLTSPIVGRTSGSVLLTELLTT